MSNIEGCSTWFSCDMCEMPRRRKAFILSNSLQDPAASKNADVPLEWQRLKDTKLQTQSLKEKLNKTARCSTWFSCIAEWFSCDRCHYKCKTRWQLKLHLAHKHNINAKWFSCDKCDHKCKNRSHLKTHLAHVHDIDVKWFSCDMCEYKCKQRSDLKRHLAHKHNIDVEWFSCNNCYYKCKTRWQLKRHLAHKHNIDVEWLSCDMCEYKCKTRGSLKTHLAQKQNINIQWHSCNICKKKFKTASNLNAHLANVHNMCNDTPATYVRSRLKIKRICKAILPPSTIFPIKGIMKDTNIIQQALFKEHPEDTKSLEFVNTHKTNCNNQIIPSRELFDFKPGKSKKMYISSGARNVAQNQDDANLHDISIKWICCDMCEYKCKQRSHLAQHLADIHDAPL